MIWGSLVLGHKGPGKEWSPVHTNGEGVVGRQNIYEVWREPVNQMDNGSYRKIHLQMT